MEAVRKAAPAAQVEAVHKAATPAVTVRKAERVEAARKAALELVHKAVLAAAVHKAALAVLAAVVHKALPAVLVEAVRKAAHHAQITVRKAEHHVQEHLALLVRKAHKVEHLVRVTVHKEQVKAAEISHAAQVLGTEVLRRLQQAADRARTKVVKDVLTMVKAVTTVDAAAKMAVVRINKWNVARRLITHRRRSLFAVA